MNAKLVRNTAIATVAAGIALALFCHNASYNPSFSVLDAVTGATPKSAAKRKVNSAATTYTLEDFQFQESLEAFEMVRVEQGVLMRRRVAQANPPVFLCDMDARDYRRKCEYAASALEQSGQPVELRLRHCYEFLSLAHAGRFDILLLTEDAK